MIFSLLVEQNDASGCLIITQILFCVSASQILNNIVFVERTPWPNRIGTVLVLRKHRLAQTHQRADTFYYTAAEHRE